MYTVDLSNFIGSWYYTGKNSESIIEDLLTIFNRPDEFNFTYDDAISKASKILKRTEDSIKMEVTLNGIGKLDFDDELFEA